MYLCIITPHLPHPDSRDHVISTPEEQGPQLLVVLVSAIKTVEEDR